MGLLLVDVYRKSYESSNASAYLWEDNTLLLYLAVILLIIAVGDIIEKKRIGGHIDQKSTKLIFIFACIVLSLLLGLRGTTVGTDTPTYRNSFEKALLPKAFSDETTEPGYQLVLKVLNYVLPNAESAMFFFSVATVVMIFIAIWKLKNQINIFIAFAFYIGLFYFQAMNLMRIYLAVSFLCLNFHLLIEEKYKKYGMIILVASLFHFSSLVLFLPLLFLCLYKRNAMMALACYVAAVFLIIPLTSRFEEYIAIARYAEYAEGNDETGHIGIMLFLEYLPSFFFYYYAYRYNIKNQWVDLLVSFALIGFFLKIISYYITIAGRLSIQFMPLYIILIPYFVNHVKTYNRRKYPIVVLGLLLYMFVRCHLYFIGYLSKDGIMPYYTIFSE